MKTLSEVERELRHLRRRVRELEDAPAERERREVAEPIGDGAGADRSSDHRGTQPRPQRLSRKEKRLALETRERVL